MRKLIILAALLASGVSAEAGNIKETINFGGRSIQIEIPKKCRDISCISLSLPGKSADDEEETKAAPATPAPAAQPAPAQTATTAPAPAAAVPTPRPAPSKADFSGSAVPWSERNKIEPQAQPAPAPEARTAAVTPAPVAAPAPEAAPATAPAATGTSPVGVWQTEKKEGLVRIQDCSGNLCGYSVEKDGSNGKQVLINMKPGAANKWKGTIHDVRGGGGKYDATITLRGDARLAVQGCAFGGMFCGGETWTRAQ